jgi:hypothetical protein
MVFMASSTMLNRNGITLFMETTSWPAFLPQAAWIERAIY